uniref:Uncharacterized protein n=1 Tax=Nicotiana tabacum TaxID=4097 RepID=A0A1S4AWT5_TOBAC|nr:PREDICTED: uncharacterized protein LOC107802146 [Nicotiana tabacum]
MAADGVNNTRDIEARKELSQCDDSITNQTAHRIDNNTPSGEVGFDKAGGTESGSRNNDNAKEFHTLADQIPCVPPMLKGPDSIKCTQFPFKPSATPELIPNRFKIPDIPKYDRSSYPQEHITTYTTTMKENDLAQHEIEIEDCRHLRKEVATLLKNGHHREFLSDRAKNEYGRSLDNAEPSKVVEGSPRMAININFRGNRVNCVTFSAAKKTKILEDTNDLLLPPNDLVISLNVLDYKIKRVLVDLGSSANIIQLRVLEQAKLTIIPAIKLLAGFNLTSVTTRGEILLPTHVKGVTKTTLFEVVDEDMGFNVILGMLWMHKIKVIPSTYHRLLQFPMPEGIKKIKGDQPKKREMNAVIVSKSKGKESNK